jgi:nicotinamidase-related amidase
VSLMSENQQYSQPTLPLNPESCAIVVIDVQNDFCHPQGLYGRLGYDLSQVGQMAGHLTWLLEEAASFGVLTIFVRATYDDLVLGRALGGNYEHRRFKGSLCQEGSWGADWFGGVMPRDRSNEIVVTKHRYSPFWGTPIDLYLRSNHIDTVVATGVVTSGCVESTVRDAFFADYRVVVVSDCVASPSREQHEASLRKVAQSFGGVHRAIDVRDAWVRSARKGARFVAEQEPPTSLTSWLHRSSSALLLVGLQNDFCDPDGVMGQRGEDLGFIRETLPGIRDLLSAARRSRVMVVHVKSEYGGLSESEVSRASRQGARNFSPCCASGTWGADFVAGLAPMDPEPVVVKHRYSGFVDTRLEVLLRSNCIRSVVIAGVATNCCIESTARDANMRDYYVIIPGDCVAVPGTARHLHDASLENLRTYFGRVMQSKDILDVWAADNVGEL